MIEFQCLGCGKQLKVKDEVAGKKGKCPKCGAVLLVPSSNIEMLNNESVDVAEHFDSQPVSRVHQSNQALSPQQPQLEHGHVQQAPSVNVHMPKRTSSLGVVSLILGIVALLFCWVPILGLLSLPLSILGVLLAGIGLLVALTRRGAGIGWPIGGGVVSGLALVVALIQVVFIGGAIEAIDQTAEAINQDIEVANQTRQEIVLADGSTESSDSGQADEAHQVAQSDGHQWASAQNAVRQDDIQLRITDVYLGKVPLVSGYDDQETTSENDLLSIGVELVNLSESKKIEYRSWQVRDISFARDYATLRDNFGNNYKRITFGYSAEIVNHTSSDSIYPGKSLSDVLVFELPIDAVGYLDLELPAKNFGGEGMLRLRIPASMIGSRDMTE